MESKNKLILLHMLDGSILQCYGKLDEITKELDDKSFLRCHQSFIVNLFHVTAMSESQFYIKEDVIGISRKYAKTAKDCYYEHLFTNMGREELT
jgi:DNA-binding LytR/AlgR family response regulator